MLKINFQLTPHHRTWAQSLTALTSDNFKRTRTSSDTDRNSSWLMSTKLLLSARSEALEATGSSGKQHENMKLTHSSLPFTFCNSAAKVLSCFWCTTRCVCVCVHMHVPTWMLHTVYPRIFWKPNPECCMIFRNTAANISPPFTKLLWPPDFMKGRKKKKKSHCTSQLWGSSFSDETLKGHFPSVLLLSLLRTFTRSSISLLYVS